MLDPALLFVFEVVEDAVVSLVLASDTGGDNGVAVDLGDCCRPVEDCVNAGDVTLLLDDFNALAQLDGTGGAVFTSFGGIAVDDADVVVAVEVDGSDDGGGEDELFDLLETSDFDVVEEGVAVVGVLLICFSDFTEFADTSLALVSAAEEDCIEAFEAGEVVEGSVLSEEDFVSTVLLTDAEGTDVATVEEVGGSEIVADEPADIEEDGGVVRVTTFSSVTAFVETLPFVIFLASTSADPFVVLFVLVVVDVMDGDEVFSTTSC